MAASKSSSAWSRQNSAVKNFSLFSLSNGLPLKWPIPSHTLRGYVSWALNVKRLSPATVRMYVSDLKNFQKQKDFSVTEFDDFFVNSMIKGAENLALYNNIVKRARLAMSYPLLKILGHEIANSDWTAQSKRVFWCACCVAFYGSFRMGELLSSEESNFCTETLTWDCVRFVSSDSAVIQLKFPKSSKANAGQFVDIFKIGDSSTCPFSCLRSLHDANPLAVLQNLPVFSFSATSFLSSKVFNKTFRNLLRPHLGSKVCNISGHSFRAAILAAIANHPDLLSSDDVCKWGRWSSASFQSYTRLKLSARKAIFNKLLSLFELK